MPVGKEDFETISDIIDAINIGAVPSRIGHRVAHFSRS